MNDLMFLLDRNPIELMLTIISMVIVPAGTIWVYRRERKAARSRRKEISKNYKDWQKSNML